LYFIPNSYEYIFRKTNEAKLVLLKTRYLLEKEVLVEGVDGRK
jgi:hypothetical protein